MIHKEDPTLGILGIILGVIALVIAGIIIAVAVSQYEMNNAKANAYAREALIEAETKEDFQQTDLESRVVIRWILVGVLGVVLVGTIVTVFYNTTVASRTRAIVKTKEATKPIRTKIGDRLVIMQFHSGEAILYDLLTGAVANATDPRGVSEMRSLAMSQFIKIDRLVEAMEKRPNSNLSDWLPGMITNLADAHIQLQDFTD